MSCPRMGQVTLVQSELLSPCLRTPPGNHRLNASLAEVLCYAISAHSGSPASPAGSSCAVARHPQQWWRVSIRNHSGHPAQALRRAPAPAGADTHRPQCGGVLGSSFCFSAA